MIYNLFIYIFVGAVRLAALFNRKIARMVKGEHEAFAVLKEHIDPKARYLWFHAASLGEFEQGRPIIEEIRRKYPEYRILQTFFSPSGYEVRKHYRGADIVCYLPLDTPRNVRRFISLAHPYMVFFIKYEFWKNYLDELKGRGIPVYSVSSIFRPNQVFFRWYGIAYRDVLKCFTHLFVQNRESVNAHPEMKLIIAPHVIDESHLKEILGKLKRPAVRYTQATEENVAQADCLIIDCFGLLSSIYRYGEISYIGGGFGVSIHNTLEAAVYGIPVIFGPENQKFREAQGLKACGGGIEIHGSDDFNRLMDRFLSDKAYLEEAGRQAGAYVSDNAGALQKIMDTVKFN